MADVLNRIVPSSVGINRVSWQGTKRQDEKESKSPKRPARATDNSATSDAGDNNQTPSDDTDREKGRRLDVCA